MPSPFTRVGKMLMLSASSCFLRIKIIITYCALLCLCDDGIPQKGHCLFLNYTWIVIFVSLISVIETSECDRTFKWGTIKPPLLSDHLSSNSHFFFGGQSMHWNLSSTDKIGHFFCPQGGRCEEVQLYKPFYDIYGKIGKRKECLNEVTRTPSILKCSAPPVRHYRYAMFP